MVVLVTETKVQQVVSVIKGRVGEKSNENEFSLREGFRILSAYHLKDDTRIWIITEADRSSTTILLPEEY